jgi:polysaccharide biosynthesis protein PslG
MPGWRRWGVAFAGAVLVMAALSAPASAASVPRGFFGVVPQARLDPGDFDEMRGVVGTLRIPVYWFRVEPSPGEYQFAELDETIARAAASGVRVLPFVYGTPPWLNADPARPPLGSASRERAWTALLRQLVRRYGPGGELWQGQPRPLPVRRWQIWNEPNFLLFWRPRPSPAGYVHMLAISSRAIHAEDRGAKIVAAGLAPVEGGMNPWKFLRAMYGVPGVKRDFDVIALHPYSSSVRILEYELRLTRRVMARAGDGKRALQITELGVASGGQFPNPFDRGARGQARYLERAFSRLLEERGRWRIAGVDWFTWRDSTTPELHCVFCQYAGLLDASGDPKPSWWAFKRAAGAAVR